MFEGVRRRGSRLRDRVIRPDKADSEFRFWRQRLAHEGSLVNDHYEGLFTDQFGLERSFFAGKRVLDIGCGPRGSLEWLTDAAERIGLDPLADRYRGLGTDRHAMRYVAAPAERMPFEAGHFDVVTSINSLDHVDDVAATISEIGRVTRPGGAFLLAVEIGHEPTVNEPTSLWFDILEDLGEWFDVQTQQAFEVAGAHQVNDAYLAARPFQMDRGRHPGVLVAHLLRR